MAMPARTRQRRLDLPAPVGRLLTKRYRLEQARRWSWALAEYCLRDEEGQYLIEADFQKEWHLAWDIGQNVTVGPRGHGKTENLIAKLLWRLGRNPERRIKYVSAEPDLATSVVAVVGEHIEKNERLHEVFPNLRPDKANQWSRHTLFVHRELISKEPSLQAWGVMQGTSGGRCTDLIGDDVCNWRNTIGQPALRAKIKTAWRDNWMKFLVPTGGTATYVATPWSTGDLTAEQSVSPLWHHWRKPAIDKVTGEVLWPERFSREYLEELLSDPHEGPSARRQYLLEAVSDEDTWFPHEDVDRMFDRFMGPNAAEGAVAIVGGVDLARSLTEGASYTVMVTAAVMPNGSRFLVDIWRERLQPVPSWEKMRADWNRWHHNLLLVENNAYQEAAVDYLKRAEPTATAAIQGFTTGSQKADEKVGLPGLAGRLSLWKVPMADGEHQEGVCQCTRCQLRAELKTCPFGEYNDCVMAMWFADTAAERVARTSRVLRAGVSDSRRLAGADKAFGRR